MMSRLLIFLLMVMPMVLAQESPDQKLGEALAADDLEAAKEALAEGADPNLPTYSPVMTSLFGPRSKNRYAERTNTWSTYAELKLLLEAGADPNPAIPSGYLTYRTPLLNAVEEGDIEAVRLLLAAGAKTVVEGDSGTNGFGIPFLETGRVANELGVTPLMAVAYANWETVADQLEAAKGILAVTPPESMLTQDHCMHDAIQYAIAAGQVELTRLYLDRCSQQRREGLRGECGVSSLSLALGYTADRSFVVPRWMKSSPLIGPKSEARSEPSDPARDLQLVQLLLDYGVKPWPNEVMSAIEVVEDWAGGPWRVNPDSNMDHEQAIALADDLALLVIANSSNLEFGYPDGTTPLIYATKGQLTTVAQALIQGGASLDAPDHSGKTALIYATQNRDLDLVKALLAAGARIDRVDLEDKTALDYARQSGNQELIELLTGAKP